MTLFFLLLLDMLMDERTNNLTKSSSQIAYINDSVVCKPE